MQKASFGSGVFDNRYKDGTFEKFNSFNYRRSISGEFDRPNIPPDILFEFGIFLHHPIFAAVSIKIFQFGRYFYK